ncbi:MAG TPA: hypothetical protein VD969_25340 [Symbiobacteriaceae bacterium]|nr:hypothetical protein [Symbiobacteriaceae bacterium]
MAKSERGPAFALGLLLGVALLSVLVWGAGRSVQKHGVTVRVETGEIAAQVEAEVKLAVRRELPATLAAIRQELPARVAAETARKLSETTVNVGGFNIPVPDAAAQQVRSAVESAVRAGLNVAVTDADVGALADRLAGRAGGMVQEKLAEYLKGRTFPVELWKGFSIPVTVIPQ